MKHYYVYIITNKTNTVLYTGVTNHVIRRAHEHKNGLIDGFTRKYKITKLVYVESFNSPKEAIAFEKKIKGWTRNKKIQLVQVKNPKLRDLLPIIEESLSIRRGNLNTKSYYKKRAEEYEAVYHRNDPVRQEEQRRIAKTLQLVLKEKDVLEVACGTGYWTQFLSRTARSIHATDLVEETLEIAKTKKYACPIKFSIEDAYGLSFSDKSFNGGLTNFWFSHIPKSKINSFLKDFHRVLKKGSPVFIADNVFIKDIGGKLIKKSNDENTYKLRKLKSGEQFLVLKNYYSKDILIRIFKEYVANFSSRNVSYGKYFWYVKYRI